MPKQKDVRLFKGEEYLTLEQAQKEWGMSQAGFQDAVERLEIQKYEIPKGSRMKYIKKSDLETLAQPVPIVKKQRNSDKLESSLTKKKSRVQQFEQFVREALAQSVLDGQWKQQALQLLGEHVS
ncbi:MAG TPA: hypothetical protein VGL94_23020 [Ktedonobacteraceae bacterium]|jgi:hypothetical protein